MMSVYKKATIAGLIGMALGLGGFLYNYHMVSELMFGYQVFAAPAMFALSFFSEETNFIPKMIIFMSGQFGGYFLLSFIIFKALKQITTSSAE